MSQSLDPSLTPPRRRRSASTSDDLVAARAQPERGAAHPRERSIAMPPSSPSAGPGA
jgi:hypothetical protein